MTTNNIIEKLKRNCPENSITQLSKAITFAKEVYKGEIRDSNDPYILHGLDTALRIQQRGFDCATVITGLLHHIDYNTINTDYITKNISDEVTTLLKTYNQIDYVIKNTDTSYLLVTRYILSFVKDLRPVIVLLANAQSNSKILESITDNITRKDIVLRNLNIHSKLAEYLGFGDIQKDITEESFRITQPEDYNSISKLYKQEDITPTKLKEYNKYIKQALGPIYKNVTVQSRVKSKYSTYLKIGKYIKEGRKNPITEIHDLIGFRILTQSTEDCFLVLEKVWDIGEILIDEYDDYISTPKPNGYKAMQGPVIFPKISKLPIEVQILSKDMYEYNTYGPASHIVYKESKNRYAQASTKYNWVLNSHIAIEKHKEEAKETLSSKIKVDIFEEEIYVLTPKNRIIALSKGDTVTDFAYQVHTDIGNSMIGAKLNGKSSRFDQVLKTGDIVEIITQKGKTHPKPELLKCANSDSTKVKINRAIK